MTPHEHLREALKLHNAAGSIIALANLPQDAETRRDIIQHVLNAYKAATDEAERHIEAAYEDVSREVAPVLRIVD